MINFHITFLYNSCAELYLHAPLHMPRTRRPSSGRIVRVHFSAPIAASFLCFGGRVEVTNY